MEIAEKKVIKEFSIRKDKKLPSDGFLKLFRKFSERTQKILDEHLILVLKVLFFKYKRKVREYEETLLRRKKKRRKRKYTTGPLYLKEKDISDAMALIDFHLNNKYDVHVDQKQDLMSNFGNFPLEDAIRWYDEYLIKSTIRDIMGRRIVFTEDGKRSLYKEHTEEGAHVIAPENYVEPRGKRLSWIKALLQNTREIYRQVESFWETFLYVGVFKITLNKNTIYEKIINHYFLLIARRKSGRPLEFVTAYYTESQQELFKHLEQARPVTKEQQEYIKQIEKKH